MSYTNWITFLTFALFTAISPGAGSILIISHGLSYGFKKTIMTILGEEIALGLIVLLVILCAGPIILSSKIILYIIKFIGAIWLIYLAYNKWNGPIVNIFNKKNNINFNILSKKQRFITGFITNITNPKAIVFIITIMPQFITKNSSLFKQSILLPVTMMLIDSIMMCIYAFTASKLQRFFKNDKMVQIQNRVLSIILIIIAVSIFI